MNIRTLGLVIAIAFSINVKAQMEKDTTLESVLDLSIEELMNTKVSIATKSEKSISEAPSVVTVISADVIRNTGAKNLIDILQYIPGFEFSRPRSGHYAIGVRGVKDILTNSRFLVLKDGIPYNDIMYGSAVGPTNLFDIESIERIEVIRGPGSALYGRNAFIGVLNIITKKTKKNVEGLAKVSLGQFNTSNIHASIGTNKNDLNTYFSFNKIKSDNTNSKLDDGMGGMGTWNLGTDNYFINTRMSYKNFTITGMYSDIDNGASAGSFATKTSKVMKIGLYSLEYKKELFDNSILNAKLYGRNEDHVQNIEIATPNTTAEIAPGLPYNEYFKNGAYARPSFIGYTYGTDVNISFNAFKNNNTLVGFQADLYGLHDVKLRSNYDTYAPVPTPLTYTDDQGNLVYFGENDQPIEEQGWIEGNGHDYTNYALYFQNIYSPVENFDITIGGRYDIDSEFGGIFNPRMALVYQVNKKLNFKLLYGQAYRAPNSQEQYRKTGFTVGNKELKPESIKTTELSTDYNIGKNINTRITLFYNVLDEMIHAQGITSGTPGSPYANIGENKSMGIEFEYRMILNKKFYTYFNYAYTNSENKVNQNDTIQVYMQKDIAPHKINVGLNYKFLKYFNYNISLLYRSSREKYFDIDNTGNYVHLDNGTIALVSEDKVGNYTLINAKLRVVDFYKGFELTAEIYNLLDTKYYDQDTQYANQPAREGRQFVFSVLYHF